MINHYDKFGVEIHIGTLVAVSTNSGIYIGKVTKFNVWTDESGRDRIGTVQVQLTEGRKRSYDIPDRRMVNLDEIHNEVRKLGL